MTLAIKTSDVSAVLLADGWHEVEPGSFTLQRLAFTDADGIEHRKASKSLGYRFLEQHRSLGTVQTIMVAGPLKAILAVRTAVQVPMAEQRTPVPAPASIPETTSQPEARHIEHAVHAPEGSPDPPGPFRRLPAEPPMLLPESVPVASPRYERDDAEPSVQEPASVPESLGSLEHGLMEQSVRPAPSIPEPSGRFEREPKQPSMHFEDRVAEPDPDPDPPPPNNVLELPAGRETPPQRLDSPPEHAPAPQMAKPSTQMMSSILLRDEMERDRLARAGHPVSEGLRLTGLGLRRSVANGEDEVLEG